MSFNLTRVFESLARFKETSFNPLKSGQCLSIGEELCDYYIKSRSFNPLKSGQCLSMIMTYYEYLSTHVSIPLNRVNVFQ